MRRLFVLLFCLGGLQTTAQYKNIQLREGHEGEPALNPSITINPRDPKNIVAAVGLNAAKYTLDGGATWNESTLDSPFGGYGNPVVVSDAKGDLYFFHRADPEGKGPGSESWLDRIVCQKSEDGGKTWSKGTFVGNNPPKDQDNPWPVIHPKKQVIYTTWTQFDSFGLEDPNCHSNVLFSMSTNGGGKWSKPIQMNQTPGDCLGGVKSTMAASPAVTMDGKIFVTWSNQGLIFFDRSYDGGETWLTNDVAISKQAGGGLIGIPGININHETPELVVNNSATRVNGNLYLVFADTKNGNNDADIWFIRSVNKGDNWTVPQRINGDEPGKHQFMPWMTVDHVSGYIYILYYDRRAYDDLQTDVYIASSIDGGNTFMETKISETPFIPTESKPFSSHNQMSAQGGVITPVWTRMDNGKTSVWTAVIKEKDLTKSK